jgi:hypothetical protein
VHLSTESAFRQLNQSEREDKMATSHDNYIFFDVAGMKAFSFTETSHSITSGQPYHGVSSGIKKEDGHDQAYIMVNAGRKNSASVANWFRTAAGNGQTIVCDSAGTYPNELNFAVQGTMKITNESNQVIVCENLIVAQGHFVTSNNWWISSPTMQGAHVSISGAAMQRCTVEGSFLPVMAIFSPKTPCVNHFSIGIMSI